MPWQLPAPIYRLSLRPAPLAIEAFSRAWRRLDRPERAEAMPPDELRLRRARHALADVGTLWRDPKVPDRLREEAIHELFVRFDIEGPTLVAAHPVLNENAWLSGQALLKAGLLPTQQVMGMVGARGVAPPIQPSSRLLFRHLRRAGLRQGAPVARDTPPRATAPEPQRT